ncbi:multi-copper oxidase [Mycena crocata]|nr:multi-copper oxidase [Mycena crocata]
MSATVRASLHDDPDPEDDENALLMHTFSSDGDDEEPHTDSETNGDTALRARNRNRNGGSIWSRKWMRRLRRRPILTVATVFAALGLGFVVLHWLGSSTVRIGPDTGERPEITPPNQGHQDAEEEPAPEQANMKTELAIEQGDLFTLHPKFVIEDTRRTRVFRWTVSEITAAPVGVQKRMVVVDGRSPGPVVEGNWDDRILVYLTNNLPEGTAIHWHALPLPNTPFYDGTPGVSQCLIPPGATLLYNFTFGGWTGTTWWHGHTDTQLTDGMFGPVVVHPSAKGRLRRSKFVNVDARSIDARSVEPQRDNDLAVDTQLDKDNGDDLQYDAEHILTLSDVYNAPAAELVRDYLTFNPIEPVPEPVPDAAVINGQGQFNTCTRIAGRADPQDPPYAAPYKGAPAWLADCDGSGGSFFNLTLEPGKTYRLRIIHGGSFAPLRFSIDDHLLTVVEADGVEVVPVVVNEITLHPAQRYSVLLRTDQHPRAYWMRAGIETGGFAYTNPYMQAEALAVLRYTNAPEGGEMPAHNVRPRSIHHAPARREFDEHSLVPFAALSAPPAALAIPFIFSIQRTHEQNWRSFINGTSWELPRKGQATGVLGTAAEGVGAGAAEAANEDPSANERRQGDSDGQENPWANVSVKVWPGDQLIASIRSEMVVDFVINNLDDGDHPFHLYVHHFGLFPPNFCTDLGICRHGYTPWIMGVGRGRFKAAKNPLNAANPMRRDTFLVPARGWTVLRIVTNNPGYWAFHCHISCTSPRTTLIGADVVLNIVTNLNQPHYRHRPSIADTETIYPSLRPYHTLVTRTGHLASGGLFQVAVQPARVASLSLPADIVGQCQSWLNNGE